MPRSRNKPNIRPLKTLRIYCEGAKTEPTYINGYIRLLSNQERKTVISVETTNKNTPTQLVDVAFDAKNSRESLPDDEFWVVYDREASAKYSDKLHASAMDKAKSNGINVALSNVCFEYWLLLHFVKTNAPFSSFKDLRNNSDLNKEVRIKCGVNYEKSSQSLFASIQHNIPVARERGKKLNKMGLAAAGIGKNRPFQINPYVGMVFLLDAIDKFK